MKTTSTLHNWYYQILRHRASLHNWYNHLLRHTHNDMDIIGIIIYLGIHIKTWTQFLSNTISIIKFLGIELSYIVVIIIYLDIHNWLYQLVRHWYFPTLLGLTFTSVAQISICNIYTVHNIVVVDFIHLQS